MRRYIDADAVISFVDAGHLRNPMELSWSDKDVVDMIESRPTVDAVPVVRCEDCKHYKDGFCYNPNTYDDDKTCGNTTKDWFCADGERKNNETKLKGE